MLVKRLKDQRGFTTVTLMGVLMVGGLLVAAAFTAVQPDISQSRADQDGKQAYAAAESGLQWYMNGLGRDNTYYLKCDNPPAPNSSEVAPVNQKYVSGTFKWRNLPGGQAKYGIELIPATGFTACSTTNQYSMIDPEGNMRLRVTGRARGESRTILATLRRQNFLDYIYFTHFETLDPAAYDDVATATANCSNFRDLRTGCQEIQFASTDEVLGPMHTNDNIRLCGTTQFGRNSRDKIEINGPTPYVSGSCSANPNFQGTLVHPAGQLEMPPSNADLKTLAAATYSFIGKTEIVLNGSNMDVKNTTRWSDGLFHSLPKPLNGVVYVNNSACAPTEIYFHPSTYAEPPGCGNAWVKGSYGDNLTIGADNDIIINGNLTHATDDLLLGLVANNFVRVYHPSCSSSTGATPDIHIEAAILALNHSFLVDNWDCGGSLGDLNVEGAIAQKFRGPVGTTGGTGYIKNYTYNDLLRYREPPYFLDPVLSSWRISRQSEQVPPCQAVPPNPACPIP
jgi:type II secretory pathway pseudopilin PulG